MREKTNNLGSDPDTIRSVQSQKKARIMKFWLYVEEELYYPCSENKGADQLHSYISIFKSKVSPYDISPSVGRKHKINLFKLIFTEGDNYARRWTVYLCGL